MSWFIHKLQSGIYFQVSVLSCTDVFTQSYVLDMFSY